MASSAAIDKEALKPQSLALRCLNASEKLSQQTVKCRLTMA
jgi:hypothetical protein